MDLLVKYRDPTWFRIGLGADLLPNPFPEFPKQPIERRSYLLGRRTRRVTFICTLKNRPTLTLFTPSFAQPSYALGAEPEVRIILVTTDSGAG